MKKRLLERIRYEKGIIMKEKYINLLINKCMDLERSKVVFISYNKEIKSFIDLLVNKLNCLGVNDIYRDEVDEQEKHQILKDISIEDISTCDYFDCCIWDEYAKKNAKTFLKKRLHIIHERCIIMQVKQGKCIFIHSISGNTLHPD